MKALAVYTTTITLLFLFSIATQATAVNTTFNVLLTEKALGQNSEPPPYSVAFIDTTTDTVVENPMVTFTKLSGESLTVPVIYEGVEGYLCSGKNATAILGTEQVPLVVMKGDYNGALQVSITPNAGATALWKNAFNNTTLDFNDPSVFCNDGDGDGVGGQLGVQVGNYASILNGRRFNRVLFASHPNFSSTIIPFDSNTPSITLLTTSAGIPLQNLSWILWGLFFTQSIPAGTAIGEYTLPIQITITAI